MTSFPMDVIGDILSRFPVKSLLRFRCVSKRWCTLIGCSHFIKLHLSRSIETKNHHSLLLRDDNTYSIDFDSLNCAVKDDHLRGTYVGAKIVGSCDGLVCLYGSEVHAAIWNPSTRKYREIPMTEMASELVPYWEHLSYGFGYDSVSDDYKVVRIRENLGKFGVKVYSMNSNSWHKIQDCPYYPYYEWGSGVLSHGALHYVVSQSPGTDPALVAAFDLADERYRLVPQPDFADRNFDWNLGVLENCLCIACNYVKVRVDVWVMREYGVKESWSKLFSVAQPELIRSFDLVMPLTYSKCGSEILMVQDNKKLLWYNIEQKRVKRPNVQDLPSYFVTTLCVESLVPLNGGAIPSGKMQQQPKKQQKNERKKRDGFLSKGFKLVLYACG